MKSSLLLIGGVSLLSVVLAGCGGSSGGSSSSQSSSVVVNSSSNNVSSDAASSEAISSSEASISSEAVSSSEASLSSEASVSSEASSVSSSSSDASGWIMVWNDEFDGDAIDPAKWDHEVNCWGGGNNEQQCYTDRPVNSYVADGVLTIVAQQESFTGPSGPEGTEGTATLPYTSARLRTKYLQEWTFGRFEIRAKLPSGQGTWPAIWMLPTDSPYGGWAGGGEIDIMEAVNLKADSDEAGVPAGTPEARIHGTLHYGRAWPGNVSSGAGYKLPEGANPADDFHEYAMEWEDGEIRWYVDDVHFATHRDTGWYSQYMQDGELVDAPEGAPFDSESEFHLLMNLAVGGNWAANVNETGIDASVFPQTMQIDYVRVYECSVSPQTGQGCATIGENAQLIEGNARPGLGAVELDGPPLLMIYEDSLFEGLRLQSYDPESVVTYGEVEEDGRGNVINVAKTGAVGNVYININGTAADLRNWAPDSELIFDFKVNSKAEGANLLVKIDSGWPNVSDVTLPLGEDGVWAEYRITLAELIANGNSLEAGSASLASVSNIFVIDTSAAMNVSFDNIRIEGEENQEDFAELPLYTIYDDVIATGLLVQSYNPSQITSSEIAEDGRGDVFNVVKTGAAGNVFFTIAGGAKDLSAWAEAGELVFDVRVNSKAEGVNLLVKMDSGWPKVSDFTVDVAPIGEWKTIRIGVAELIANGNSIEPGSANLAAITNIFAIEPSGVMDVSFDNIRLVVEEGEPEPFAEPPLFTMYDDAIAAGLLIQSYNPSQITSAEIAEDGRGDVFNVVKTGAAGNVFFTIADGAKDFSAWAEAGELVFDVKVNSKAEGVNLLVKMDSGWPSVSDFTVDVAPNGEWKTIRIGVAELIANGNSIEPGSANLAAITNTFAIEPSGVMDVSFDNIRLVVE